MRVAQPEEEIHLSLGVDMGDPLVVPVYAETMEIARGICLEAVELIEEENENGPEDECQLSHDMRGYIIW